MILRRRSPHKYMTGQKNKSDKNGLVVNVSHGTSISDIALARSKTIDAVNSKAHDNIERTGVLYSGASYHIVNVTPLSDEGNASIRDAT